MTYLHQRIIADVEEVVLGLLPPSVFQSTRVLNGYNTTLRRWRFAQRGDGFQGEGEVAFLGAEEAFILRSLVGDIVASQMIQADG